jgi:hypothetical protein
LQCKQKLESNLSGQQIVKESDVNNELKYHHRKAIYTTRKDMEISSEALNHKP